MNQKSLNWGVGITVIWLAVIFFVWFLGGLKSPESLNELGDALAGIVAPIAFFWLIMGYIQQGEQLDQNTKALEQQERALQLQIDEMREGIKQQTELNQIQQKQFDAMNYASNPNLLINSCKCELYTSNENEIQDLCKLILKIDNNGLGEALDIKVEVKNKKFILSKRVLVDEGFQEIIYLEPDLVMMSKQMDFLIIEFILIYNNKFNFEIRDNYITKVFFIENSWEVERIDIIRE